MSTELNTGADWEQSKRLLIHWHNMWAKEKDAREALTRELAEVKSQLELEKSICQAAHDLSFQVTKERDELKARVSEAERLKTAAMHSHEEMLGRLTDAMALIERADKLHCLAGDVNWEQAKKDSGLFGGEK